MVVLILVGCCKYIKLVGFIVDLSTVINSRMSRVPASHSGGSGLPKISGLGPEPVGLNPGQVKSMTLKLILVTSDQALRISRIGQGLVGLVPG